MSDRGEPRYTQRIVILEEPKVIERVRGMAEASGHSLAAEIRQALRWWLRSNESEDRS